MEEHPSGGRTGGVYIPPFKLAQMRKNVQMQDGKSEDEQKMSWEALRKSINGLINKVNVSNIKFIIPELFNENLIRGRGLLARAILKAQLASPGFTHIYAALVAVLNTKLPENGELILKRVIYGFKRAYKRRDKIVASALAKFIAHLVNHQVAHELLALQLLTVLLEDPTDDSVEIAVNFIKEVGQVLSELSPQGLHAIFERFRALLHEGDIDKRVQYTIEGLFAVRKSGFADYPSIPKELDLVEREDQITFETGLDDDIDREEMLDIFRYDPNYSENEELWKKIKSEILGDDDDGDGDGDGDSEEGEDKNGENDDAEDINTPSGIVDMTEQELINLRRTLYLTIMSSASFEECTHKIIKLKIPDGAESELCNMLLECCANERSYQRYYGLMGQRFCMLHRKYQDAFDAAFVNQYAGVHRLETNKLRNVAKFFAHLLSTDALPWTCLEIIKLNENDTTSSSRIFIKILAQELSEALGLATLSERFDDPCMQDIFSGLFPRNNARDTRFAINFFTSIGLGGLTDGLREHLKNAPKILAKQMEEQMKREMSEKLKNQESSSSSISSSSSDSSSSSSDSSSSDDNSSTSSDDSTSSGSSSSTNSSSSSNSSSDNGDESTSSSEKSSVESDHQATNNKKNFREFNEVNTSWKSSDFKKTTTSHKKDHLVFDDKKLTKNEIVEKSKVRSNTRDSHREVGIRDENGGDDQYNRGRERIDLEQGRDSYRSQRDDSRNRMSGRYREQERSERRINELKDRWGEPPRRESITMRGRRDSPSHELHRVDGQDRKREKKYDSDDDSRRDSKSRRLQK